MNKQERDKMTCEVCGTENDIANNWCAQCQVGFGNYHLTRILSDDDGHLFFVPVGEERQFQELLNKIYSGEDIAGAALQELRQRYRELNYHLSCYVFADARLKRQEEK